jgi:hypothetical protein
MCFSQPTKKTQIIDVNKIIMITDHKDIEFDGCVAHYSSDTGVITDKDGYVLRWENLINSDIFKTKINELRMILIAFLFISTIIIISKY